MFLAQGVQQSTVDGNQGLRKQSINQCQLIEVLNCCTGCSLIAIDWAQVQFKTVTSSVIKNNTKKNNDPTGDNSRQKKKEKEKGREQVTKKMEK